MVRSIPVGNRHGHSYYIDDKSDNTGFCIRLFYREYNDGNHNEHEVAKIKRDNKKTIFLKLFEKPRSSNILSYDRYNSITFLDNNWEDFADKYERNHRP